MAFLADAQAQWSPAFDDCKAQLREGAGEENSGRSQSSDEYDLRSDDGTQQSQSAISYAISATNVTSIFQQGPGVSVGSVQHPNACEPCVYYCFSKRGCNKGEACTQCHGFHESKLRKKRAQWKKDVRSSYRARVAKKISEEAFEQNAEVETANGAVANGNTENTGEADFAQQLPVMGAQFVYPAQANPPFTTSWPAFGTALPTPSYAGTGVDPMKMLSSPAAQIFAYSQSSVSTSVGQKIELFPKLPSGLIFAVAPDLPKGLELDIYSGWISGSAREAQGPATYFVTACEPGALIDMASIKIAVIDISIDLPLPVMSNLTSFCLAGHESSFLQATSVEKVIAAHLQEQLLQTVVALRRAEQPPQIHG